MNLLYNIDLSNKGEPDYVIDNSDNIGAFERVAYQLELIHQEYGHQIVYISMNPFSDNPRHLGIPDSKGCNFNQKVLNLLVKSNCPEIKQGRFEYGKIEFSQDAYSPMFGNVNKKYETIDEQDRKTWGCLQFFVNNTCLFAYNNFNNTEEDCDLGIGNSPTMYSDWSFTHNGDQYIRKTLQIYVKPMNYTRVLREESRLWKPCYSLDIPILKKKLEYNFNCYNYRTHNLPFDRIGYILKLSNATSEQNIWISMDAFTSQHCDITVPDLNGLVVNRPITNLHVVSNTYGEQFFPIGHIIICPYNYVPDYLGRYGFCDTMMNFGEYGCFQIYAGNPLDANSHCLIAYNNFYSIPDLGIGNNIDVFRRNWTGTSNAYMFESRKLEIAVKPCVACNYIEEVNDMKLVYSIQIPDMGHIQYNINNYEHMFNKTFTRVSYFIQLNDEWMYISFDWNDISKIGIPSQTTCEYVRNATIKTSDKRDIKSKKKVWIRFTPFDYIPFNGVLPENLYTGTFGCIQIGYKSDILFSASNIHAHTHCGFDGFEQSASLYQKKTIQIFVNRNDFMPDVVFLVTGQSNSQGTGGYYEPWNEDDTMNDNILSWNIHDKTWELASLERYMGTKPMYSQCFGFHFAKHYIQRFPNAKIGLVVCGAPGQSISRWSHKKIPLSQNNKKDTGDVYDKTIIYTKEALAKSKARTIEGILWHQGESDHNESFEYYRSRLTDVIYRYRCEFGEDTTFVAGELIKCGDTYKQNRVLRELNHNDDIFTRCAFSKNLEHCGDNLHFSTQSHRDLGEMYFEQYMITQYMSILSV